MVARHRPPEAARRVRGETQIEELIQGTAEVEVHQHIAASPATVFSYLTDPAKFVQWMGVGAQLDPRPGGRFRIEAGGENIATGEYREVDPPHRVVMTWGWENNETVPPGSTTVEITLTPEGNGTALHLRHTGLPTEESRATHRAGWAMYTGQLQKLLM